MSERFVVEGGVVTDTKTGLQWEAEHHGMMTWDEALEYAKSLRLGGYDDWRLPTIEELLTLVDFSKTNPTSAFPGMPREWFWSSSSYSGSSSSNAWGVAFDYGDVDAGVKSNNANVRCIRRGADEKIAGAGGGLSNV